jgi:hypothetical protein
MTSASAAVMSGKAGNILAPSSRKVFKWKKHKPVAAKADTSTVTAQSAVDSSSVTVSNNAAATGVSFATTTVVDATLSLRAKKLARRAKLQAKRDRRFQRQQRQQRQQEAELEYKRKYPVFPVYGPWRRCVPEHRGIVTIHCAVEVKLNANGTPDLDEYSRMLSLGTFKKNLYFFSPGTGFQTISLQGAVTSHKLVASRSIIDFGKTLTRNASFRRFTLTNPFNIAIAYRIESTHMAFVVTPEKSILKPKEEKVITVRFLTSTPMNTAVTSAFKQEGNDDEESSGLPPRPELFIHYLDGLMPPICITLDTECIDFVFDTLKLVDMDFGYVMVNSDVVQSRQLENQTDGNVDYRLVIDEETLKNKCLWLKTEDQENTVKFGEFRNINFKFSPKREMSLDATVSVETKIGVFHMPIKGVAVLPKLTVNVERIDYGVVGVGYAIKKQFVMTSACALTLKMYARFVTFDGDPVEDCRYRLILPPEASKMAPMSSVVVEVVFTPLDENAGDITPSDVETNKQAVENNGNSDTKDDNYEESQEDVLSQNEVGDDNHEDNGDSQALGSETDNADERAGEQSSEEDHDSGDDAAVDSDTENDDARKKSKQRPKIDEKSPKSSSSSMSPKLSQSSTNASPSNENQRTSAVIVSGAAAKKQRLRNLRKTKKKLSTTLKPLGLVKEVVCLLYHQGWDEPLAEIELTGRGGEMRIKYSERDIHFGNIPRATARMKVITVENQGQVPVLLGMSADNSGNMKKTHDTTFGTLKLTCPTPLTVQPGEKQEFKVQVLLQEYGKFTFPFKVMLLQSATDFNWTFVVEATGDNIKLSEKVMSKLRQEHLECTNYAELPPNQHLLRVLEFVDFTPAVSA